MKKLMNERGFSLVELLIVIAIMAAMLALLAPAFIQYVEKSKHSRAEQNATNYKDVVEVCLVDALSGKLGPKSAEIAKAKYHAISSEIQPPADDDDETILAREIYNTITMSHDNFEMIALVDDYQVKQLAYKDLDSLRVYVWFVGQPKGSELQSAENAKKQNQWLIFDSAEGENWIPKYAQVEGQVRWNGYADPSAHKK